MPLNDYHFREHWEIPATRTRVYDVLSDGALLPDWWKGVYLESAPLDDGELRVGSRVRVKARGALPYRLRFLVDTTALEQDELVEVATHGDCRRVWRAKLSDLPDGRGTRVYIDWRVKVEKPLIRFLSPLLKPLFAWNHNWTTPRGEAGLTVYLAACERRSEEEPDLVVVPWN